MKVPYKDFIKKYRDNNIEYLSVVSSDKTILVENYKIFANRSFIISENGTIKPQKYGGGIWIDDFDVDHYPHDKNKCLTTKN